MATVGELLDQGLAHHKAGRLDAAEAAYGAVLEREPGCAEAHHLMGVLAFGARDIEAAIACFVRATEAAPGTAKYHGNLGAALLSAGRVDEAVAALERANALDPASPDIRGNLAAAWHQAGRMDEAIALCRAALESTPEDSVLRGNLAASLLRAGRAGEALAEADIALARDPRNPELLNTRGGALRALGRIGEAAPVFEQVVTLDPNLAEGWVNLGFALQQARRFDDAARAYGRAIALRPRDAGAHIGLARTLRFQGRPAEALALTRKAVALAPRRARFHSNLLFHLLGDPDTDAAALRAAHREWDARHGGGGAPAPFANAPDPDRPLRIGYVSGDFRNHPVGRLVAPVIAAHDRAKVTVHLYAQGQEQDATTDALRAVADIWRDAVRLDDPAFGALVREDGIDILIDLSGHSAHNRMPAFARRLAPVQASWLGYQSTTGLAAMDWLITDAVHLPEGRETEIVERPARLPNGLLAFVPPAEAPPVAPLPADKAGAVAFCSFNNPGKITPACAAAWGRVLAAAPGSTLLLRYRGLEDAGAREGVLNTLSAAGIAAARVRFEGSASYADVLAAYGRADIALDTFPYSGAMTTLEALWMGVPVIALRGGTIAARQSAAHLAAAGLDELTAGDVDGYVALAAALAADRDRLRTLRAAMRDRLRASPLCDVAGFAAGLEDALRMMWRDWCGRAGRL
jgi:predicted O-linked N-acetylglucosamine transferase (SPINDLY family)